MPHSGKPGWQIGNLALGLLLSLFLHGLLLLTLWYWPLPGRTPTLSIESAHFTIDTRVLDPGPSTLMPAREMPPDFLGTNVTTGLAPRLEETRRIEPQVFSGGQAPVKRTQAQDAYASQSGGNTRSPYNTDKLAGSGEGGGSVANLFPLPRTAASVVYVLDRSVSMGFDRKLDRARQELIASLRHLPPTVRFQVIDYNDHADLLVLDGRRDLLPARPEAVEKAIALLQRLDAAGKTNHLAALRCGLDLHPDVLYFLTDADDLGPDDIRAVSQRNRGTIIHTIELSRRRAPSGGPLAQLAIDNHGNYRRVWLTSDGE